MWIQFQDGQPVCEFKFKMASLFVNSNSRYVADLLFEFKFKIADLLCEVKFKMADLLWDVKFKMASLLYEF